MNQGLILYDFNSYKRNQLTEQILTKYILKNFWYFINEIKKTSHADLVSRKHFDPNLIKVLEENNLKFEFPRASYRCRGGGSIAPTEKEEGSIKIGTISPKLSDELIKFICNNVNATVHGKVLFKFNSSCVSKVVGYRIRKSPFEKIILNTSTINFVDLDKKVPIKITKTMGIAEKLSKLISDAKEKLKTEVSDIESRTDMTDEQKVTRIGTIFSTTCAAIAVQPIPFADFFVLTPIQGYMGKKIADIRGFDITESGAKEIFKELAGLVGLGFLAQQFAIGAYKTVLPFISGFTTIPLVFGLTFGMAKVMDYYFVQKIKGQKVDKDMVKNIFKNAKAEGPKRAKENKDEINKRKQEL